MIVKSDTYKKQRFLTVEMEAAEAAADTVDIDIEAGSLSGREFAYVVQVRTAAGAPVAIVDSSYATATGLLTVNANFTAADIVTVMGTLQEGA